MNGAILLYGGSSQTRLGKIKDLLQEISATNILELEVPSDRKSIGIEQVRQSITFINKKPFLEEKKAISIPKAERMTADAQNALLKTLEEPPVYALIILSAKTQDSLLPTVISRCQRISADNQEGRVGEREEKNSLNNIKRMSVDDKFEWSQETSKEDKEQIIKTLEEWVSEEREYLSQKPQAVQNINLLLEIIEGLEKTNVNTRLALDTLLLNLL